jgi:hypothetical protein
MFLRKVFSEVQGKQPVSSMQEELERIVGICTMDWMLSYFSREVLWSEPARSAWVEPDLRPVDF